MSQENTINGVDIELKSSFKVHNGDVKSFLFFHRFSRLVTASKDCSICVIDLKTGFHEKRISDHQSCVFDLCKVNGNTFLSCCQDGLINAYSVSLNGVNKIREVLNFNEAIISILAISKEEFCFISTSNKFVVFNYYTNNKTMMIDAEVFHLSHLLLSKNFNLSVFLNTFEVISTEFYEEHYHPVKLIDCQTGKTIKVFKGHRTSLFAMDSYINHNLEEILLTGGSNRKIYIYNTTTTREKKIKSIRIDNFIRCLHIFNSRFLIIGTSNSAMNRGEVQIFDIAKPKKKKLYHQRIHNSSVNKIEIIRRRKKVDFEMISASQDFTTKQFVIKNLGFYFDR